MLKYFIYCLLILMIGGSLWGAPKIDTQRFKPSFGISGMMVTDTSEFLEPFSFGGMLYLHYDKDSFVLKDRKTGDTVSAVEHVLQSDLVLTFGLPFNIELGVVVPVTLYTSGTNVFDDGDDFSNTSLGDVQFGLRYLIPRFSKMVGMGFTLRATAPTGSETSFNSSDGFTVTPGLFIDLRLMEKLLVAFNVAYLLKKDVTIDDLDQSDELTFKAGAKYSFTEDFELLAELSGSFQATKPFEQNEETALEAYLGAGYYVASDIKLIAGGAAGISPGAGTPLFRAMLGIGYVPRNHDWDNDGILNKDDLCPKKPEDKDNFKDTDGCPDPDNDKDGILDPQDNCPNDPEDKDNFEDTDGCPDPDNDKDGILDKDDQCINEAEIKNGYMDQDGCPDFDTDGDGLFDPEDKCPKEAEDKDGFKDEDGCPELDNDGDGVVDTADKCPGTAATLAAKTDTKEDKDGFEDEDGCPDEDNDKDGIVDKLDKCPNEPENYNGNEDADGCPDKGKELVKVNVVTQKIEINQKVFFKYNSAVLSKKSYKLLMTVASILSNNKQITQVRIEGHTDDLGNPKYNKKLSQKRAKAVMNFLIKKGKIDPKRLSSEGYGSEKPVAPITKLIKTHKNKKLKVKVRGAAWKALKKARESNRRVDFVITQ